MTGALLPANLMLALPVPDRSVTSMTGVVFTQFLSEDQFLNIGKINTLDRFEQPLTGASGLTGFQNTAFIFNPIFARTEPYSTLGIEWIYLENEEPMLLLAVYDSNDSPTTSGLDTFFDNGVCLYGEWNIQTRFFDLPGHHGLSGTYSNGTYTSLTPSSYLDPLDGVVQLSVPKTGSWSLAYNVDQAVYVSPENPDRAWGVFGDFGIADSNPNPIQLFACVGISGFNPMRSRSADSFGIGFFFVGVSEQLKNRSALQPPLHDELGVELFYNAAVSSWYHLTTDIQVIEPFRADVNTGLLLGVRAHIDF